MKISNKDTYVILSCVDACYTNVQVTDFDADNTDENVVAISGPGFINDTEGRKDQLLKFNKVPYTFTANLENGG